MSSRLMSRRYLRYRPASVFAAVLAAVTLAAGLASAAVTDPSYQIHNGDQLAVSVYGDQALTQTTTVLPDGNIQYPLIGKVHVAGLTTAKAADAIGNRLHQYVRHPLVTVNVAQQGQLNIVVLGNVKTPGKYQIRPDGHLTDAIAVAGGLGPVNGDLPVVRITRPDGSLESASLQKLLHDGDGSQNVALGNDATVYVVGPNTFRVQVIGAVDRPGAIDVNEGDRLSVAISRAGTSAATHADLNRVHIVRLGPDNRTQQSDINMYLALQGGNLNYDPILHKGDTIFVPQGRVPSATGAGWLLSRLLPFPFGL